MSVRFILDNYHPDWPTSLQPYRLYKTFFQLAVQISSVPGITSCGRIQLDSGNENLLTKIAAAFWENRQSAYTNSSMNLAVGNSQPIITRVGASRLLTMNFRPILRQRDQFFALARINSGMCRSTPDSRQSRSGSVFCRRGRKIRNSHQRLVSRHALWWLFYCRF